jgi:hypothetical protein
VLYAASAAGATRVLRMGGAQAIAALALGTRSVPRVDKIVGPGNAWVTAAKDLVTYDSRCAIDFHAGPSEIVILSDDGPAFDDYFGDVLRALDNMVDRSPEGRLRIDGGCLRNVIRCNWKIYLENINDTVHPMSTHQSAVDAAHGLWKDQPADAPKPMAMEQILPFGAGHDFFDRMGGRILPNGHSVLGTSFSIHSGYAQVPDYEAAMRKAHGEERAFNRR